jgi:GNAT superfamily N-acetyltransferase
MTTEHSKQLNEIDRSEFIEWIYTMKEGTLTEISESSHECPNWTNNMIKKIEERYIFELTHGGVAIGAFDEAKLVGFGVLAHKFRGESKDQLQIDLMYVSRNYRRQGIGSRIFQELSNEAVRRGAKYL